MKKELYASEMQRLKHDYNCARHILGTSVKRKRFLAAKDAADFIAHTIKKMHLITIQFREEKR